MEILQLKKKYSIDGTRKSPFTTLNDFVDMGNVHWWQPSSLSERTDKKYSISYELV